MGLSIENSSALSTNGTALSFSDVFLMIFKVFFYEIPSKGAIF